MSRFTQDERGRFSNGFYPRPQSSTGLSHFVVIGGRGGGGGGGTDPRTGSQPSTVRRARRFAHATSARSPRQ